VAGCPGNRLQFGNLSAAATSAYAGSPGVKLAPEPPGKSPSQEWMRKSSVDFILVAAVAAIENLHGFQHCKHLAAENLKSPFQPTIVLTNTSRAELHGLTLGAVLDMRYHEIRSVVGLSNEELISFVHTFAQSVCIGIEFDGPDSRCSEYLPKIQDSEALDTLQLSADQIRLSSLIVCLNQSSTRIESDRGRDALLSKQYSIPNAAGLFHSRNWVVLVMSAVNFVGEQHYNQRRAFQEFLFLMRQYGGDRGLVEPVFVYNPRDNSVYETLSTHDPETLSVLSPSDVISVILWNNTELRLTHGIFASPAGALLDMPTLSRALKSDILPYRSFLELSGQTLDELIITDSTLTGGFDQPELDCSRQSETENVKAELLGDAWSVSRFRCLTDTCVEPSFGQALVESEAKTLGVAPACAQQTPASPSANGRNWASNTSPRAPSCDFLWRL
jgi:hypothetical protein